MRKINILILSILLNSVLISQTTSDSIPVLPSDEVEVVKSFEAITKTAKAVFPPPGNEEEFETGSISSFNYNVNVKQEDIASELPNLRPLAYTTPVVIDRYDGFIDISFANPKSPKVDYGYNYNIEDWFELGFSGNYFSSDDEKIAFRDHRDHGFRLYGKYFANKNVSARLSGSYSSSQRFFYGTGINTELLQEDVERSLLGFNTATGIDFDYLEETGMRLDLGIRYRNIDLNKFGQHEHLSLATGLFQMIIGEGNLIEIDSDVRYYVTDPDLSISSKQFLSSIKSKYYYNAYANMKADIGFDVIRKHDSWAFQPNIDLRYDIHKKISILAGSKSIADVYDTEKLFELNSFVTFDNAEVHTHTAMRPYIGFQYIDARHDVKVITQYNREKGIPLFGYRQIEDIPMYSILALDANYYSSSTDYTLHLNNTKLSMGGEYRYTDNVNLANWRAQLNVDHALFSRRLQVFMNAELLDSRIIQKVEVIRLAPRSDKIYDITLGARVKLNSNFGIQGSIINLIGKEYQDWFAYPVYGRQYRAGAFIKF